MSEVRNNIVDLRRRRDELYARNLTGTEEAAVLAFANARPGQVSEPDRRKVMIAHQYPIMIAGIGSVVEQAGQEVVATCSCPSDLLGAFFASAPDLVIVAASLCQVDGDFLRLLKGCDRMGSVVVIGDEGSIDQMRAYMDRGVGGVVTGSSEDALLACVSAVAAGKRWVDADRWPQFQVRLSG